HPSNHINIWDGLGGVQKNDVFWTRLVYNYDFFTDTIPDSTRKSAELMVGNGDVRIAITQTAGGTDWKTVFQALVNNYVKVWEHFLPGSDNAFDIGSINYRWRNAYLSGSLQTGLPVGFGTPGVGSKVVIKSSDFGCGQLQIGNPSGNEASIAFIPQVTLFGNPPSSKAGYTFVVGTNVWGIGANYWGIGERLVTKSWVWKVSHTGEVTQKGRLLPANDNALDIGSETLRWRNGHFAGSLFVDGDVYGVRVPIIWDDTLVSAGTSETEVKYARFAKHSTYEPISRLIVLASLWTTSGTAYLKVYINDEASPRLTLSTTSTSETLVAGEVDISDLGDGIHTIHVKIYSDSGTAYNKLLEVWGVRR
ncbi:hypothetical protein DRJ17_07565, partial [Candidatus Woesearchaeota archaeon]